MTKSDKDPMKDVAKDVTNLRRDLDERLSRILKYLDATAEVLREPGKKKSGDLGNHRN